MMETMADQVKAALRESGRMTPAELEVHFSIASYAGRKGLRQTLRDLLKSGAILRLKGTYGMASTAATVQDKIWRAACLKSQKGQRFTIIDLAVLAGCGGDYARRYVRFLADQKYLQEFGLTGHYSVWPGQEKEPAPHWNRRAQKRQQEAEGRTGKLLLEMADALSALTDGVALLTAIFQDFRAALPGPPEANHAPEDRG